MPRLPSSTSRVSRYSPIQEWHESPCDREELKAALEEPPLLVDLPGLEEVAWEDLSHAYGPATEVPRDLRKLASSDIRAGGEALQSLYMTILHQGSFYSATPAAVPFLVEIASHPDVPWRPEIIGFLREQSLRRAISSQSTRLPPIEVPKRSGE